MTTWHNASVGGVVACPSSKSVFELPWGLGFCKAILGLRSSIVILFDIFLSSQNPVFMASISIILGLNSFMNKKKKKRKKQVRSVGCWGKSCGLGVESRLSSS